MSDELKKSSTYSAESIRVMEGLEAVRKRPAMYIGSTSVAGLHHLVYEVVDNSVDEALAGVCTTIDVTLHTDGSCSVRDNGRGIPTGIHPTEKISAAEVVLTKLHAGGKFDKESYKFSGGLHGVGVSVVNALSEWFEVKIYQNGSIYEQRLERGKPLAPLKVTGKTTEHGTYIRFKPDAKIFTETTIFSFDTLSARLRELAFLNKGLKITIREEEHNKVHEFLFQGGIVSFVEDINKKKTPLFPEVLYFEKEGEGCVLEIAFQYNDGFNEQLFSFVNNINTIDGGTHVTGFKSALTKTFNKRAQKLGMLKGEESLSSDDVREGLVAVINMKVPEPQFEGQTKTKLGNSDVKGMVDSWFGVFLDTYFEENPATAKKILQKALVAQKAREAARKARDLARRKTLLESSVLPGKLADCSNENPADCELFIVEGDSAGGSAKQARDRNTQAILPLRGKILNVEKAHLERILSSEEIKALISAAGAGIGDQCDVANARYHKIIIMTDADVDGAHIRTLLLTLFFRHMRQLIEVGYLYIAQPPLFKVKLGKAEQYLKDERALKTFLLAWAREHVSVILNEKTLNKEQWNSLLDKLNAYEQLLDGVAYDFKVAPEHCHALALFLIANPDAKKALTPDQFDGLLDLLRTSMTGYAIGFKPVDPAAQATVVAPRTLFGFVTFKKRSHEWEVPIEFFWSERSNQLVEHATPLMKLEEHSVGIRIADKDTQLDVQGIGAVMRAIIDISKPFMTIQRYKGLGEMNPDQLWETAMDPKNRQMLQVTINDALEADAWFATLMGDDVEGRRSFIELNGRFVQNLDV